MLAFWLTLSQYLNEKRNEVEMTELNQEDNGVLRISVEDSSTFNATSNYGKINRLVQDEVVNWVYLCFIKYWIFLSSGMLLLMSCQNDVVAYRIGYMILFLYFITTFQVGVFWFSPIICIYNKNKFNFEQPLSSKIYFNVKYLFKLSTT